VLQLRFRGFIDFPAPRVSAFGDRRCPGLAHDFD
jgi:hypothetical protein